MLLVAIVVIPVPVAAHLTRLPGMHRVDSAAPSDSLLAAEDGAVLVKERGYRLSLDPRTGRVTVASVRGREYTDFPLSMSSGPGPRGSRLVSRREAGQLESTLLAPDGRVLERTVLQPSADSFMVRFSAVPEMLTGPLRFFSDGAHGLDLGEVHGAYTPDPTIRVQTLHPVVGMTGRTPFSPPPFDLELATAPGWVGVGLVEVPSATTMSLAPDGGIAIDYPPALVRAGADLGAGPPQDGMVRFPEFVVTFASDPLSGLRAYHDALSPRGESAAAAPPGDRPEWWSEPLVDTWGEQVATRAARSSPLYTADWVRRFVAEWHRRFGVGGVTVVIDSRWQARIGDPEPDPVRFGGLAGLRQLIDALHADGDHVLLWYPLWAHDLPRIPPSILASRRAPADQVVDPTSPSFERTIAATTATLLGSGPGQLDADGLKLDWGYDYPVNLADPGLGWGTSALYRYMAVLHAAAHGVRPDALVDASAAAPQFAAVVDSVRLYDAWSEADWNARAAVVSETDPDVLIDGDGWQASAANIVAHTISSTVYGTPALYYASHWADGTPMPPAIAAELGVVAGLSPDKGQGRPLALAGGDWEYVDGSAVTARSFDHGTALVVWRSPGCGSALSAIAGRMVLPLAAPARILVRDAAGRRVATTSGHNGLGLVMAAGSLYDLRRAGSHC